MRRFLVVFPVILLSGCALNKISTKDLCKACLQTPEADICTHAYELGVCAQPTPKPTPSPEPTPTPTPQPSPTPTPTPTPTPEPTPVPGECRWSPVPVDGRYINLSRYGQGLESTPRMRNKVYCDRATTENDSDCKVNPEGSNQTGCDTEFLGQNCPIWQFQDLDGNWKRCLSAAHPVASCDHFDHWKEWKGDAKNPIYNPYTGRCETNAKHEPESGFFMIPHGKTCFRACDRDGKVCAVKPICGDW